MHNFKHPKTVQLINHAMLRTHGSRIFKTIPNQKNILQKATNRNYVFYFLAMDSDTLSFQLYFSIAKRCGINFALTKQSKKLLKGSKEFTQLTQNMAKQMNFFEDVNKLTIRKRSSLVSQTHLIALATGKSTPHSRQVNITHSKNKSSLIQICQNKKCLSIRTPLHQFKITTIKQFYGLPHNGYSLD